MEGGVRSGTRRKGVGKFGVGGGTGPMHAVGTGRGGEARLENESRGSVVGTRAPGARPKARPAPLATNSGAPGEKNQGWPVLEQPYKPPEKSRVVLAEQLEALEQRAQEFKDGDPRIEKARERIQEVQNTLKDAGGRTANKLYFSLLEGHKEVGKRGKMVQDAKDLLEKAKMASAAALEEEAKAEAWVQACAAREENCRYRNAHLAFQVAVEATVGIDGYQELEQKVHYLGATLAAGNQSHAREAFEGVAWFVSRFAPQTYSKADDPLLQELASSDPDETVQVGGGGEGRLDGAGGCRGARGYPERPLANSVRDQARV